MPPCSSSTWLASAPPRHPRASPRPRPRLDRSLHSGPPLPAITPDRLQGGHHAHGHIEMQDGAKHMLEEVLEGRKEVGRPIALAILSLGPQAFSMAGKGPSIPILLREAGTRPGQRGIGSSILAMMVGMRMRMEAGRGEAVASRCHLMAPDLVRRKQHKKRAKNQASQKVCTRKSPLL